MRFLLTFYGFILYTFLLAMAGDVLFLDPFDEIEIGMFKKYVKSDIEQYMNGETCRDTPTGFAIHVLFYNSGISYVPLLPLATLLLPR